MLELDSKQQFALDDLLKGNHKDGALLPPAMGTGKTLVAVEYCKQIGAEVVLLILPLNTRIGWQRTFEGQGVTLPFKILDAKHNENYELLCAGEPGIYAVGREFFHCATRKTKTKEAWDWKKASKNLDVAIFDEIHRCANRKSKTFRTLKQVQPKSLRMGLSGTWFGNSFEGAWAVTKWLWPALIPNSFWSWVDQWAKRETLYVQGREVAQVTGEKVPGAFVATLPAYYYWDIELDVDYIEAEPLYVEMTPKQAKIYKQMEDDLLAWIDENPMVAKLPVVKYARLRQIALGVPSLTYKEDDTEEVSFDAACASPKIDALEEFLEDHTDPLLILTDSAKFAPVVAKRIGATLWYGATSQDERDKIKLAFQEGKIKLLVATIQSIAEGTDGLQDMCNTVLWLSKCTNGLLNEQAAGRLYRRGQQRPVTSIEIRSVGTTDDPDNDRLAKRMKERISSMGKEMQ